MDVSEHHENSICEVENYVEQYYSTHQDTFANPNGCIQPRPFKFPPGHRMQITYFVKEVKQISKIGQKHRLREPIYKVKRRCVSNANEPSGSAQSNEETIATVSKQIRCSASAWVQKETDPIVHSFKENKDFSVNIKTSNDKLFVECIPCNTTLKLHPDPKKSCSYILLNWTRHVANCKEFAKERRHPIAKAKTLHNFFQQKALIPMLL